MPLAFFLSTLLGALLGGACFAPPSQAQDPEPLSAADEAVVDEDLARLDESLDQVEASTRRYFFSWWAVGAGLTFSQAYVAATWDSPAVRGSYWIGTALASTSLVLQLVSPKPALFGVKRYRALPSDTPEARQAKRAYGEQILLGQAKADRRATSVAQHLLGVTAAVGSGLGVALGWDSAIRQAVTRALGVFLVAELQIISRPRTAMELSKARGMQLGFAPMIERGGQGLMLTGTF